MDLCRESKLSARAQCYEWEKEEIEEEEKGMPKKSRRTTSDRKILEEIKERYKKFPEIIEIIKKDEKEKRARERGEIDEEEEEDEEDEEEREGKEKNIYEEEEERWENLEKEEEEEEEKERKKKEEKRRMRERVKENTKDEERIRERILRVAKEEDYAKPIKVLEMLGIKNIEENKEVRIEWILDKKKWGGVSNLILRWKQKEEILEEEVELKECKYCEKKCRGEPGIATHWRKSYETWEKEEEALKEENIEDEEERKEREKRHKEEKDMCLHKAAWENYNGEGIEEI